MVKYQPPVAYIVESVKVGEIIRTTIKLNEIPSSPIAPALIYSKNDPPEILLELHRLIDRKGDYLVFATYDVNISPLISENSYDFYAQWSSDQLELAQDDNRKWQKEIFVNKDRCNKRSQD